MGKSKVISTQMDVSKTCRLPLCGSDLCPDHGSSWGLHFTEKFDSCVIPSKLVKAIMRGSLPVTMHTESGIT